MASRTRPPISGSKCRWILLSGWAPKGCQNGSVDLGSIIDPHMMKGENWPLQALLWLPHHTVTSSSLPKYGHILRWHCVPPKGTWFSVSQKWSVTWHGLPALGLWVQQWLYHSFFLWFCIGGWLGAGDEALKQFSWEYFLFVSVLSRVSCIPGCSQICRVAWSAWNFCCSSLHLSAGITVLFYLVLGIRCKASCMLGRTLLA